MARAEIYMVIDLPSGGQPIDRVVFDPTEKALAELVEEFDKGIKPAFDWWKPDDQPVWKTRTRRTRTRLEHTRYTDSTPYLWVTGGTKTPGRAVFPKGWKAATSQGVIGRTGPGGPPIKIGTRPRGTITARNFEDVVLKDLEPRVPVVIMKHVTGGIQGRFWGPQKRIRMRVF